MPAYSSPASQSTGAVAPVSWANAVKAGLDYLANPPACRANRSGGQTISNNTTTAIQFNGADSYDINAMHDVVTNNSRITVPYAGLYAVTLNVSWPLSGTAMIIGIRVNGATNYNGVRVDGSGTITQHVSDVIKLAANDYIEGTVFQLTGSNKDINAASLSAVWVGLG